MGGEPNQGMWRGIRPTDPAENIPVDIKVHTVDTPVIESLVSQNSVRIYIQSPVSSSIYGDSGQLTAGWYDFNVSLGCDVSHRDFVLQHRNAANDDNLHRWCFMLFGFMQHEIKIRNWYLATNERMRIEQFFDITGRVEGCVWWNKRSSV